MKIRLLSLLFVMFVFSLYGCAFLFPEHETKTRAEYYTDSEACDKDARAYIRSQNLAGSEDNELDQQLIYSRRCLKEKGWFYFKKSK